MAKRKGKQEPALVRLDGGLCVTLVNSRSAKRRSFETYSELLAWGHACGAVSGADVERLERAAAERRADAAEVVRRALELRARCRRIFQRLMDRQQPLDSDLEVLRAELATARAAQYFARSGLGCRWVWGDRGGDDLDRMLWPVATSMGEVLSTKYCLKVGRCAGEGCDLMFVDRSPGSRRKWCVKRTCGRKVTSRRDYQRRVKPAREASKRRVREKLREENRRAREAREREAEERPAFRDGKRPGPRVA